MKFKIGDVIVGTPQASQRYSITTEGVKCEVIAVKSRHEIEVKVMEGEDTRYPVFLPRYSVDPKFFTPICSKNPNLEELNDMLLNALLDKLPKKIRGIQYDLEWCDDHLRVGCNKIPRKTLLELAKIIDKVYGE